MFTPKVMVIRMSKMAHLMYFLLNTEKNRPSLVKCVRYLNASERSDLALLQKYYGLWGSVVPLANCQHLKLKDFTSALLTQHFF